MAYRTITQRCATIVQDEAPGHTATIYPGMLVEIITHAGGYRVQPHGTAQGSASVMVAVEDELQGKDVADGYAADQNVIFRTFRSGDQVAMLLSNGETVAIGTKVESNGDGRVQAEASDIPSYGNEDSWLGIAMEAATAANETTLILVRIR